MHTATSRHVCTVTACFLQLSEDSSLQPQFLLTILYACKVTLVITDTLIAVLTYLLTQLINACISVHFNIIHSTIWHNCGTHNNTSTRMSSQLFLLSIQMVTLYSLSLYLQSA